MSPDDLTTGTKQINDPLIKWAKDFHKTLSQHSPDPWDAQVLYRFCSLLETIAQGLSEAPSAFLPLDHIAGFPQALRHFEYLTAEFCNRPHVPPLRTWMQPLWKAGRPQGWMADHVLKEPISLEGTLNDIFNRAAIRLSIGPPAVGVIAADFKRPFLGSADVSLDTHVKYVKEEGVTHYNCANVIPIVQSTGSGKSRTVMQLARSRLGMLVCIRDEDYFKPAHLKSVPPQDRGVMRDLTYGSDDIFSQTQFIATWLIALAKELLEYYQEAETVYRTYLTGTKIEETGYDVTRTPENWKAFKTVVGEHLKSQSISTLYDCPASYRGWTPATSRIELLEKVRATTASLRADPQFSEEAYWKTRPELGHRYKAMKARPGGKVSQDVMAIVVGSVPYFFDDAISEAFNGLTKFIADDQEYFHLAIDECRLLGNRLFTLRELWPRTPGFFLFLLDTNPTFMLSNDAGSLRSLSSMEPFTAIPMNLALRKEADVYMKIVRGETPITHEALLRWLPTMGRPLWNDTPYAAVDEKALDLVMAKFMKQIDWHKETPWQNCRKTIACIAHRIPLTFMGTQCQIGHPADISDTRYTENGPNWLRFAVDLVNNHMRRLVSVTNGPNRVDTCSPSEPILSLAVTRAYQQYPEVAWDATFRHLAVSRANYGFCPGPNGEEVVRLYLACAADFAWTWNPGSEGRWPPLPVRLSSWLKEMFFGQEEGPASAEKSDLLETAEQYWINFTHFTESGSGFASGNRMDRSVVAQAHTRRAAIIGAPKQEGWSILIPIYKNETCPTGAQTFDVSDISYIPVQIRNDASGDISGARKNFAFTSVAMPLQKHPMFVTIWFDLRGRSTPCEIFARPALGDGAKTRSKKGIQHYHLTARGHTADTLKLLRHLGEKSQQTIPLLLGVTEEPKGVSIVDMKELRGATCWQT